MIVFFYIQWVKHITYLYKLGELNHESLRSLETMFIFEIFLFELEKTHSLSYFNVGNVCSLVEWCHGDKLRQIA